MKRRTGYWYLLVFLLLAPQWSRAQIDLYSRINDPRALAYLNNADTGRQRYVNGHGFKGIKDPIDNAEILAQDSGAGVISHLWMTFGSSDSLTVLKIYIDGKLALSGKYDSLFIIPNGIIRTPIDTFYPGAVVADIQLPYHTGFKITISAPNDNFYYAIGWRPYETAAGLPPLSIMPINPWYSKQLQAEARLRSATDPWHDSASALTVPFADSLLPGNRDTVFDLTGSAMIHCLRIQLDRYTMTTLDSLWLTVYWDNNPAAAINVPIGDFFCTAPASVPIRTLGLQWDNTNGFTSYLPMPFSHHATIVLENRSSDTIPIKMETRYQWEKIDRTEYGYLYTAFSEIDTTKFAVDHHVLHVKGRGRYFGLFHYIPNDHSGVSLEGDPVQNIDSLPQYFIRYTGGEDYYNSGWWFNGKVFSAPFAGHTKFFEAFYRFHILDAIDFKHSFDFELQHGMRSDNYEHYRTTAYYYKETLPFWTSRDTIRAGEEWIVSGSGYIPGTPITVTFDSTEVLFTTSANNKGNFRYA